MCVFLCNEDDSGASTIKRTIETIGYHQEKTKEWYAYKQKMAKLKNEAKLRLYEWCLKLLSIIFLGLPTVVIMGFLAYQCDNKDQALERLAWIFLALLSFVAGRKSK